MKRILPLCLLLAACQTNQPTVKSLNAAQAAREGRCEQQGYKRGSKDFYTCTQLAANKEAVDGSVGVVGTSMAVGTALMVPAMILSDERVKRDVSPAGQQNGFALFRFKYLWSDDEYVGVMAQEVQHTRPDAVIVGSDGLLRVNYRKIGIALRRLN